MDRSRAERNVTTGLLAAGLAMLFFGLSFLITIFYIA
jgi:sugar phosphate permease